MKSLLSPTGVHRRMRFGSHGPVRPSAYCMTVSSLFCSRHLCLQHVPLTDFLGFFAQAIPLSLQVQHSPPPPLPPWPCHNSSCPSRSHWNPTSSKKPSHTLPTGGHFSLPHFYISLYVPNGACHHPVLFQLSMYVSDVAT